VKSSVLFEYETTEQAAAYAGKDLLTVIDEEKTALFEDSRAVSFVCHVRIGDGAISLEDYGTFGSEDNALAYFMFSEEAHAYVTPASFPWFNNAGCQRGSTLIGVCVDYATMFDCLSTFMTYHIEHNLDTSVTSGGSGFIYTLALGRSGWQICATPYSK
jgi:hypothetical protein